MPRCCGITGYGDGYRFDGVEIIEGPNYAAERGQFTVFDGERVIAVLQPEKRVYPVSQMPTTEAAILTTWLGDHYVVVGDADGKGGWATRIYYNPLVAWLWIGTIVMAVGGMVSLSDRRHRIGAPRRTRAAVAA